MKQASLSEKNPRLSWVGQKRPNAISAYYVSNEASTYYTHNGVLENYLSQRTKWPMVLPFHPVGAKGWALFRDDAGTGIPALWLVNYVVITETASVSV